MLPGNDFHIACYFAAFLISFTCLIYTFLQKRTDKLQNKMYILMLIIVTFNAISGTISVIATPLTANSQTARIVCDIGDYTYFLFHTALCPAFYLYVSCVAGAISKHNWTQRIFYGIFFYITEIMVILNPFFHWIYYYDSDNRFTRGWGESLIYVAAVIYFLLALIRLLFSWKAVNTKRRFALMYFVVIVVSGVVIQFVDINIKGELFAEALALMGVMLAVESEDDLMDVDTGFYNRKALRMDVNSYIVNKNKFEIICIKVTNADVIQKVTGSANADILADVLSDYLKTIVPRYHIYQTNPETFVLTLMDRKLEDGVAVAGRISDRFDRPWDCGMTSILLNAVVMVVKVPTELTNTMDLFYMVDSMIPQRTVKKVMSGKDLDYILRRGEIENAIARGLEEDRFEVFYQPTYYMDGLRLHGAEALVRLNDSIMGRLFPDEFIPVAEQVGMIDAIDDFVLKQVCDFLESGIPGQYGIDCINVNLSVMQCLQPGFVKHICKIVDGFDVEKSWINFEITESIAASDYEILSGVVSDLKSHGFRFAMDDYGTGYSNMQSIFSLDFDVVKIDKSILWGAEETELGKIILGNSVRMIDQMNRQILVEGVETKEQVELLKELSVDYLQGYYFSKPIPKQEFIEFIQEKAG